MSFDVIKLLLILLFSYFVIKAMFSVFVYLFLLNSYNKIRYYDIIILKIRYHNFLQFMVSKVLWLSLKAMPIYFTDQENAFIRLHVSNSRPDICNMRPPSVPDRVFQICSRMFETQIQTQMFKSAMVLFSAYYVLLLHVYNSCHTLKKFLN